MKFWLSKKKKHSFDEADASSLKSSRAERFSCGLIRRNNSWTSASLRSDEWRRVLKKYKKRWSTNRRYIFGKLKNEDLVFTNVILGRALGSGASGTVYVADLNGHSVAVKIVSTCIDRVTEIPEVFISGITHPNLVQIIAVRENIDTSNVSGRENSFLSLSWDSVSSGSFSELAKGIPSKEGGEIYPTKETWIMMEYCDMGSLQDGIHLKRFHRDSDLMRPHLEKILAVSSQISEAMVCLHRNGVVHGDLKTQNVFLKTNIASPYGFVAKIGDFGASRRLQKNKMLQTGLWGTVDHMPPEVLRDGELRSAADVFSFGMILLEFITARRPFHRKTSAAILVAIVQGVRPEIPSFVPGPYSELIQDCWHQDWKRRPDFKDIHRRLNAMLPHVELWNLHIEDQIK